MSHAAMDAVVAVSGAAYLAMRVRALVGRLADHIASRVETARATKTENGIIRG